MQLGLTTLSALLLYWTVCSLCCALCSDAKKRTGRQYEYMKDQKNDISEVRTYKRKASRFETREIVLSTPARKKKLWAPATRFRLHGTRRDLDQCVRPGFSCPSTYCFAEKCSCEEKSWRKYEKLTNIRAHLYPAWGHRTPVCFLPTRRRIKFKKSEKVLKVRAIENITININSLIISMNLTVVSHTACKNDYIPTKSFISQLMLYH